jgi:RNA polymerase sigma factor for flagellar operon FliA
MFDHIRRTLPDSRGAVKKRRMLDKATANLEQSLRRAPSAGELAAELGWSEAEVLEAEASRAQISSIDESYDEGHASFTDPDPSPFDIIASLDDREALLAALNRLPERLQMVLQLFFVEELNLTEIAAVLEVSVPRVHQLRSQALGKMRGLLEEQP